MAFMIYALFHTFTQFISEKATFIEVSQRLQFARTLIFGLMGVEVLLALATSYFRKRNEWAKSVLVTVVAFIITYYNHLSIEEIFATIQDSSEAVKVKLMLTNWLIFGLGEIVSLLMNSKGKDQQDEAPPGWFQAYVSKQGQGLSGTSSSPISISTAAPTSEIGFHYKFKDQNFKYRRPNAPRGPSINYDEMKAHIQRGLSTRDIVMLMGCSESSVRRFRRKLKEDDGKIRLK